jgi:hypothetical protein
MQSYTVKAVITAIVVGGLGALWLGIKTNVGKVIALPLARDAHHGGFRTIGLLPNMEGLVPPKKQEKSNDLHA